METGTERPICRVMLGEGAQRETKGRQLEPVGSQELPIFYLLLFLRFSNFFISPRRQLGFSVSQKRDFVMSNAAWQKTHNQPTTS